MRIFFGNVTLTPSGIKTDEEYAAGIEPWMLNAVNKLVNSRPAEFVLKHSAFDIIPLKAFKADKKLFDRYLSLKGNADEYSRFIDLVVGGLAARGHVIRRENRAYVSITQQGIERCQEPLGPGSWNKRYYPPDDRDPKTPRIR